MSLQGTRHPQGAATTPNKTQGKRNKSRTWQAKRTKRRTGPHLLLIFAPSVTVCCVGQGTEPNFPAPFPNPRLQTPLGIRNHHPSPSNSSAVAPSKQSGGSAHFHSRDCLEGSTRHWNSMSHDSSLARPISAPPRRSTIASGSLWVASTGGFRQGVRWTGWLPWVLPSPAKCWSPAIRHSIFIRSTTFRV